MNNKSGSQFLLCSGWGRMIEEHSSSGGKKMALQMPSEAAKLMTFCSRRVCFARLCARVAGLFQMHAISGMCDWMVSRATKAPANSRMRNRRLAFHTTILDGRFRLLLRPSFGQKSSLLKCWRRQRQLGCESNWAVFVVVVRSYINSITDTINKVCSCSASLNGRANALTSCLCVHWALALSSPRIHFHCLVLGPVLRRCRRSSSFTRMPLILYTVLVRLACRQPNGGSTWMCGRMDSLRQPERERTYIHSRGISSI